MPSRLNLDAIRKLAAQQARPVNPGSNQDIDRGYWYGHSPEAVRVPARAPIDRPIYQVPTMEREPESAPPQKPAWVNSNCPPWVCPPFWSVPVDLMAEVCLPFYETQAVMDPCIDVPQDYFLVIKRISYEALNGVQGDVFQFDFLVDNSLRASFEDVIIDAAQPNPAHKYGLAGHTRQMPLHLVVDRNKRLCIRAMLRGAINLAGLSPHFPGDPILTGDCHMRIYLQGWLANLRENVDGGPRPTDLGDVVDTGYGESGA